MDQTVLLALKIDEEYELCRATRRLGQFSQSSHIDTFVHFTRSVPDEEFALFSFESSVCNLLFAKNGRKSGTMPYGCSLPGATVPIHFNVNLFNSAGNVTSAFRGFSCDLSPNDSPQLRYLFEHSSWEEVELLCDIRNFELKLLKNKQFSINTDITIAGDNYTRYVAANVQLDAQMLAAMGAYWYQSGLVFDRPLITNMGKFIGTAHHKIVQDDWTDEEKDFLMCDNSTQHMSNSNSPGTHGIEIPSPRSDVSFLFPHPPKLH